MKGDEIARVRKKLGWSQRQLADGLDVPVALVREWERGEKFATKAAIDRIRDFESSPPKKPPGTAVDPLRVYAEPEFQILVRKLAANAELRAKVAALAKDAPDPLGASDD